MPTTETLLQSPTIDLIDNADLLWVWNSSASALTKATRASVVGDIDLLFSNGSDKQISINNSPAATVGRQLTVQAGNVASGTNLSGGNLILEAGVGTGTGNSNLIFSTGESTGSTTSVQTLTERMRITNSGKVGIGTANPRGLLHLGTTTSQTNVSTSYKHIFAGGLTLMFREDRDCYLSSNAYYENAGQWFNTYADFGSVVVMLDGFFSIGTAPIQVSANTALTISEKFRVQENGNVGIGTASPGRKLHVAGTIIVDGDEGGIAGTVGFTDVSDLATRSTGVGTIKFDDATNRDSSGFIKIYIGTTAYYVPVFAAI